MGIDLGGHHDLGTDHVAAKDQPIGPAMSVPSAGVPSMLFDHDGKHVGDPAKPSGEYIGALELPEGTGYKHSSGRFLMEHDGVGLTFWLANGMMFAGMLFFFVQSQVVPRQWAASVTTAGLVCLVAFYNYCYMRAIWVETQQSPQIYRYTDWLITVPLQILEFYLILSAAAASVSKGGQATVKPPSTGMCYRLLTYSLVMLFAGYAGDVGMAPCWPAFAVGMAGWLLIIYEVMSGEAAQLKDQLAASNNPASASAALAYNAMTKILVYGWAMYPIGYIVGHTGPAADSGSPALLNVVYNVADGVNKGAFGLAVYAAAQADMFASGEE